MINSLFLSASGYYDSYSSSSSTGISVFVSIVTIVVAVLQIILFFKIWAMTNRVNDLKKYFIDKTIDKPNKLKDLFLANRLNDAYDEICSQLLSNYKHKMYYSKLLKKQELDYYQNEIEQSTKSIESLLSYVSFTQKELPEHLKSYEAFIEFSNKLDVSVPNDQQ